jgi:hypothetical protein
MVPVVRPGTMSEREQMRRIEIAAGARFSDVGLAEIVAHDPFSSEQLAACIAAGRDPVARVCIRRPVALD